MCITFNFLRIKPTEHLQKPVNSNDEGDVVSGQADRCQHYDHGDKSCLRDSSCSDTGCCGSDTDGGKRQKFESSVNFAGAVMTHVTHLSFLDKKKVFLSTMADVKNCQRERALLNQVIWAFKQQKKRCYSVVQSVKLIKNFQNEQKFKCFTWW